MMKHDVNDEFMHNVMLKRDVKDEYQHDVMLKHDVKDEFQHDVMLKHDVKDEIQYDVMLEYGYYSIDEKIYANILIRYFLCLPKEKHIEDFYLLMQITIFSFS